MFSHMHMLSDKCKSARCRVCPPLAGYVWKWDVPLTSCQKSVFTYCQRVTWLERHFLLADIRVNSIVTAVNMCAHLFLIQCLWNSLNDHVGDLLVDICQRVFLSTHAISVSTVQAEIYIIIQDHLVTMVTCGFFFLPHAPRKIKYFHRCAVFAAVLSADTPAGESGAPSCSSRRPCSWKARSRSRGQSQQSSG